MERIKIENLDLFVGEKKILKNININAKSGEFVVILGKNGNGKTSIFKAIMNHYNYKKKGTIFYNNIDITNLEPNEIASLGIWYVPQISSEIKGLKVYDFLRVILEKKSKLSNEEFLMKINLALNKLQLNQDVLERDVNVGFSGGEKKKLELLQLIIMDPHLILLDEIDSGLDSTTIQILIDVLLEFKEQGKTVLIITHNLSLLNKIKIDMQIEVNNGKIERFIPFISNGEEI